MTDKNKQIKQDKGSSPDGMSDFNPLYLKQTWHEYRAIPFYCKKLGLTDDHNCLVLTPDEHYFYGEEDLKNIRTLINLKSVNLIKNPDKFLHNLYRILQPNANFIGCFKDNKSARNYTDKSSSLLNWFINFLEKKPEHRMSKGDITELLETHGFRIMDMTEIDGLTFFCSKNVRKKKEQMYS